MTTETLAALPDRQFRELRSYRIVREGLPKRVRAELDAAGRGPRCNKM